MRDEKPTAQTKAEIIRTCAAVASLLVSIATLVVVILTRT